MNWLLRLVLGPAADDRPPKRACPGCGRPYRAPVEVPFKDPVARYLDGEISLEQFEREVVPHDFGPE